MLMYLEEVALVMKRANSAWRSGGRWSQAITITGPCTPTMVPMGLLTGSIAVMSCGAHVELFCQAGAWNAVARWIAHGAQSPAYSRTRFSRSALLTTDTDDRLMAAAAMMGESNSPNTGYSTPAATGTPSAL